MKKLKITLKGAAKVLSPRELEVLQLTADGLNCKQTARRLTIRASTVSNHRRGVYLKLGVENSVQAVVEGWRLGLCSVDGWRMVDGVPVKVGGGASA